MVGNGLGAKRLVTEESQIHISAFKLDMPCETNATGWRQPNHIHSIGFFFLFSISPWRVLNPYGRGM